jgi:hypothetical protein
MIDVVVYFPVGYHLPENEIDVKRDILHLFQVLAEFTDSSDRVLAMNKFEAPQSVDFPLQRLRSYHCGKVHHGFLHSLMMPIPGHSRIMRIQRPYLCYFHGRGIS